MAKIPDFKLNADAWDKWVAERPPAVQELCRKFPADRLYRIKDSGHRCTIRSYVENGTVTVDVTGKYNLILFDRNVFGIKPEDLEECDLPPKNEILGTALTNEKDIKKAIREMRKTIKGAKS